MPKRQINSPRPRNNEESSIAIHLRSRVEAWTPQEISTILSLSRKHIYKMAKAKRIPYFRLGGAIRFDPIMTSIWWEQHRLG